MENILEKTRCFKSNSFSLFLLLSFCSDICMLHGYQIEISEIKDF